MPKYRVETEKGVYEIETAAGPGASDPGVAAGVYESTLGPVVETAKGLVSDPVGTAKGFLSGLQRAAIEEPWNYARKTGEAMVRGDAMGVIRNAPGMVPVFGPQAEHITEMAEAGQPGRATGNALGMIGSVATTAIPKGAKISTPRIANGNAAEVAAMDYLESRGASISAGARTGNVFVKNIQKAADSTPLGAAIAHRAQRTNTAVLRADSDNLIRRALPDTPADEYYAVVRQAEADPINLRNVGDKDISLPVNVGEIKDELRPAFEEMQWMPATDRNASAGYAAIKKFIEGPDYIPASQAEVGLSGIKNMERTTKGRSQAIAKFIIPKLQGMIDDSVSQAGPRVVEALQKGRKAASAENAAEKLQTIFDKAKAEGGFNREAGIWQDWQRERGQISRQIPPALMNDLDNFFLGAKKLAENPNPSGTTVVGISASSGTIAIMNPATGVPIALGAGALSALLHSRRGVRLLTRGMSVPISSKAAAGALVSQILRASETSSSASPVP